MLYLTNDAPRIEAALKACHAALRAAGFEYKRIVQSGLEQRCYQDTRTMRTVNISGWHGTNKRYGDGRVVHDAEMATDAQFAYDRKTLVNGKRERVEMGGKRALGGETYDYQGLRTYWVSEQARNAVLSDIDKLPGTISDWLQKTA